VASCHGAAAVLLAVLSTVASKQLIYRHS
jgi:hypothetical protein